MLHCFDYDVMSQFVNQSKKMSRDSYFVGKTLIIQFVRKLDPMKTKDEIVEKI
jgi:hypothetical protein